ncbi:hypothetical protein M430DRAFT_197264 [Amorphotheca resinae ATCC 22711]|uniref:Uncharacterized protein n=1 Tax=Amorphotheca resinae ATCC 22711 TaxID=857342 RepID=A0A2T3B9N3_AMORE|nr:hypothetical protein M430DRAFT_197264 [Amorphotheca resinae ATCC 22711]PSS24998.1 hypothetical protein M430DRAFT_197264 [Amorphotheca resinae ATCC 22711]
MTQCRNSFNKRPSSSKLNLLYEIRRLYIVVNIWLQIVVQHYSLLYSVLIFIITTHSYVGCWLGLNFGGGSKSIIRIHCSTKT